MKNREVLVAVRRVALWMGVAVVILALTSVALAQGGFGIPWWVVAGGGGHAEGGSYALDTTLGQPVTGVSMGGSYELCAGYWCGSGGVPGTRIYLPMVQR